MNIRQSLYFFSLISLVIIFITHTGYNYAKKALVVVPVADLVGRPIKEENIAVNYGNIPPASEKFKRSQLCPRLHQLIFNEIVDITNEHADEVCINISNVYYLTGKNKQTQISYWTAKRNIIPFENIKKKGLDLNKIPKPIEFSNNGLALNQDNTITLVFPWKDNLSQKTFSAGTRFVLSKSPKGNTYYSIYIFDTKIMNFRETQLPKRLARENSRSLSNAQRSALFIKILRHWANNSKGLIPYVWGGCSFIDICKKDSFEKKEYNKKSSGTCYFMRQDMQTNPCTGFDCSGMIARAAQASGIPYFFKNTTTLARKLSPLQQKDMLHEGDLIWFPGHVMIVANIKNNTLIEARGYGSGYGKVHEIPLKQAFRGINDYDSLLKTYFAGKPLILLNRQQKHRFTLSDYKILKLSSVWG